jgi:hypothetical protein
MFYSVRSNSTNFCTCVLQEHRRIYPECSNAIKTLERNSWQLPLFSPMDQWGHKDTPVWFKICTLRAPRPATDGLCYLGPETHRKKSSATPWGLTWSPVILEQTLPSFVLMSLHTATLCGTSLAIPVLARG